jgi:hypothetical protein
LRWATRATSTSYFCLASRMAKVLRKAIWALLPPRASIEAASLVPTSILKARPVILVRQSAMAVPPLVIRPVSTDGTKVMTMGLSAAPNSPALGLSAVAILSHLAAGTTTVGAAGAFVGAVVGAAVGATVGATGLAVGTAVGGGVGEMPQAVRTRDRTTRTLIISVSDRSDRPRFI